MHPIVNETKSKCGYSLLEVIVVMAILAVVSAFSYHNYMAWIPGIRLNGAVRQVMSDLIAARMVSVKENVSVAVSPANNHSYAITIGSQEAKTIDLHPNFPGTTLKFTTILFSSRGTSSPRAITIQNTAGTKTITVAITGRVKSI
jgi:type IV fimbrial biogenesis protein FimT